MAEEISLQITANGDVAKKTLGDLKKEVKDTGASAQKLGQDLGNGINAAEFGATNLKTALRQMREQLQGMDSESKAFRELAARASNLEDKIADVNARVKLLSSDTKKIDTLVGAGMGIAGAFQAASGAMALFGSKSEAVQNAIKNVIAVQGIMNGVQMVANVLNKDHIVGMQLRMVVEKGHIALTKTWTAIQWLLNAAMTAFPITLLIAGILALGAGIVWLIKNLEIVIDLFLSFYGLSRDIEAQEKKASQARLEQFKKEVEAIKEKRRLEKEAFTERQKQFDLTIARMEAEGKSSNKLKLQKLQDSLDETKAVLKANEDIIAATVKRYETEAALRGMSRDQFLKSIGIDATIAEKQINEQLQSQRDAIFSAETNLIALKTEMREKNNADAQKKQDELDAIALKAYEAELKRLHDLQAERNRVLDEVIKLENAYYDSQLTAQEREANAVRDKYFSILNDANVSKEDLAILKEAQEAELLAIEQKYLDLEFDAMEAAIDKENELKKQQAEEETARRQQAFDDTISATENLLNIADSLNNIFHQKELARIKQKQDAGIRLSKAEERRLRREEKIQKAFALAQIVKDTATGVAAAVRAGAGVPFPGNILAITSGVAAVLAGIKNASALLGGSPPSISDSAEQAQEATGNEQTNIPNPVIQAGSTFLNPEPIEVYVTEGAITSKQKSVEAIVAEATYG